MSWQANARAAVLFAAVPLATFKLTHYHKLTLIRLERRERQRRSPSLPPPQPAGGDTRARAARAERPACAVCGLTRARAHR